jgi:hypothetical protein
VRFEQPCKSQAGGLQSPFKTQRRGRPGITAGCKCVYVCVTSVNVLLAEFLEPTLNACGSGAAAATPGAEGPALLGRMPTLGFMTCVCICMFVCVCMCMCVFVCSCVSRHLLTCCIH